MKSEVLLRVVLLHLFMIQIMQKLCPLVNK